MADPGTGQEDAGTVEIEVGVRRWLEGMPRDAVDGADVDWKELRKAYNRWAWAELDGAVARDEARVRFDARDGARRGDFQAIVVDWLRT